MRWKWWKAERPLGEDDDGDTGEPGDAEFPWELQPDPEDAPEDVPPVDPDVPVDPQDPGTPPADPGEQDPGAQPTSLGTFLILLATAATVAASRFRRKGKKRA